MSKTITAKPNIIYYIHEKTLKAHEEGKIIFKHEDEDSELKVEVCGRLANGYNIKLHD
tara:strand:+ start:822 stop:995 length:174 start_codon:yes stop_codon:yes gene_type:complete